MKGPPREEMSARDMNRNLDRGSVLGTFQLAELLGVTFRQLDWAARKTGLQHVGTGHNRIWSGEVIRQLQVAATLTRATPKAREVAASVLPYMVDLVLNSPPPQEGWAVVEDGKLTYYDQWEDVRVLDGAVVVEIIDLWPEEVS